MDFLEKKQKPFLWLFASCFHCASIASVVVLDQWFVFCSFTAADNPCFVLVFFFLLEHDVVSVLWLI